MLKTIERITRQPIDPMQLPSAKIINEQRVINFKHRITDTLNNQELSIFEELILNYQKEHEIDAFKIASALALMAQGTEPLLLNEKEINQASFNDSSNDKISVSIHADPLKDNPAIKMRRYRVAVGRKDNIKPGNVLGAIANEAEISSEFIGAIQIFQDFTTVDLPDEMPKETIEILKKTRVFDKKLSIEELTEKNNTTSPREKSDHFKKNSSRRGSERKFERKPRGKSGGKPNRHKDKKFSRSKPKR
jgi:ATP-dependent RNA helicase DeaD